MLRRLEIENYGLIARAGVEFSPGATIFTGETGSGKTMLLGALDFALGARAGAFPDKATAMWVWHTRARPALRHHGQGLWQLKLRNKPHPRLCLRPRQSFHTPSRYR